MSATKYKVSTSNGKELRVFLVAPAEYAFFGRKESEAKSCIGWYQFILIARRNSLTYLWDRLSTKG